MGTLTTFLFLVSFVTTPLHTSEINNCALKIANNYNEVYTHVVYNNIIKFDDDSSLLLRKLQEMFCHVAINIDEDLNTNKFPQRPDLYIVLVNSSEDYENFLMKLYRTSGWNPRAEVLVIVFNEGVEDIIHMSWNYYLLNVAVLDRTLQVYTYFPFKQGNCPNIQPEIIHNCKSNASANFLTNNIPKFFNQCPLRVMPMHMSPLVIVDPKGLKPTTGVEITMLEEISKKANISLTVTKAKYTTWGFRQADGSLANFYVDLSNQEIDLVAGMILSNNSYLDDFDSTYPHWHDQATFYVPSAVPVEMWKNFMMVFDNSVWLGFFLGLVGVSITWWIIGKVENKEQSFGSAVFHIWSVALSAFNEHPVTTVQRSFFLMWCLTCFVLSSGYQSKLISFLTKPAYEHQISTFEEMINSNLGYGGYLMIRELFRDETIETYKAIYRNWVSCGMGMDCFVQAAEKKNFGLFKGRKRIKFSIMGQFMYPSGRQIMVPLKEDCFFFTVRFDAVKGLPYYNRMNEITRRLIEGGFLDKWENDLYKETNVVDDDLVPLQIKHLRLCFFIIIMGNVIAFLVFLAEIAFYRRNMKNRSN